jgi:hypothetical protein
LKLDELPFTQKRFCDLYRMHQAYGNTEHVPLVGLHALETDARNTGKADAPVRIGNAARKLVLQ